MSDAALLAGSEQVGRSWRPLIAACLGTFLILVHMAVVTVALPRISADLGAGDGAMQWIVNAFSVAMAGTVLAFGSLSDVLGRRRVYLVGAWLFSAATAACAAAPSAQWLVVARAVQGLSGAAMFAAILPLVGLTYRGRARATAFAVWGTVAGSASAVGTFAGGVITEFLGWRWIFLGSLPICAVALVLAIGALTRDAGVHRRLDWLGMVAFSVAATAFVAGVTCAGEQGGESPWTWLGFGFAVSAGGVFWWAQARGSVPMMPVALFGTRRFRGVLLVAFGYYFCCFGPLPVLSLWLSRVVGLSPLPTSVVLIVQVIVSLTVSALLSGKLHDLPPRVTLGGAMALIGVGCLSPLVFPQPSAWVLIPMLVLTGVGVGVVSPIFPSTAIASVPAEFGGTAGAAANTARQLGLALGMALCGALFTTTASTNATTALHTTLTLCAPLALITAAASTHLLREQRSSTTPKAPHPPHHTKNQP